MIDFSIVFQNILTLAILGFFGWLVYSKSQGNDALGKLKINFGKVFQRTKLK